jgi:hypothetical protein
MPLPDKSESNDIKRKWLLNVSEQLVDSCVEKSCDIGRLVNQTIDFNKLSNGPFKCRQTLCEAEYVFHSARVR